MAKPIQSQRADLGRRLPAAFSALLQMNDAAERAAVATGFELAFVDLLRVRVSQLNGCAYCMRMHSMEAMSRGESGDRLATVGAWRDTALFCEEERAALALVEAVTQISDHEALTNAHDSAHEALTSDQVVAVSWVAMAINTFNRVAISSGYMVGP